MLVACREPTPGRAVAALAFPLFHSFSFHSLGKRVGPAKRIRIVYRILSFIVLRTLTLRVLRYVVAWRALTQYLPSVPRAASGKLQPAICQY